MTHDRHPAVQERDNFLRRLKKIAGICASFEQRAQQKQQPIRDTVTTDELYQIHCLAQGKTK